MAPLPAAPGVAKATIAQECSGRTFGTRVFIQNGTEAAWSLADLALLAESVYGSWNAHVGKYQDAALITTGAIAQDLTSAMGLQAEFATPQAGTFGGTEQLPLNVQARVTFPTSYRYRGGRPGFNITGIDKTILADERSLLVARVSDIIADVEEWLRAEVPTYGLSSGVPRWVLVSYFSGHAERVAPLITAGVTVEVQTRVCTLRKRLGKGEAG